MARQFATADASRDERRPSPMAPTFGPAPAMKMTKPAPESVLTARANFDMKRAPHDAKEIQLRTPSRC
jgi:hypothetical protein